MGDRNDNAMGDFILFDSNFEAVGTWTKGEKKAKCGYDFWYQPKFNVMVASEWGAPKNFKQWVAAGRSQWTSEGFHSTLLSSIVNEFFYRIFELKRKCPSCAEAFIPTI